MKFTLCLSLILLVGTTAFGQRTDVIVMKNGDRLTCEITGVDHGTLYAKLDYVDGTIEIDWSKVAKIESNRLFIIKTDSGAVHTGAISSIHAIAGKIVNIEVLTDANTKVKVDTSKIVTLESSDKSFFKRFNGSVNFGMNFAKGNDTRQYNLSAYAEYPREHWGFQVDFSSNLQANEGVRSSKRNEIRTRIDRDLKKSDVFITGGFGFLQSTEQGISKQTTYTGGLGFTFVDSSRAKVTLIGGMAWQRTSYNRFDVEGTNQNQAAAVIATEVRYFKFKRAGLNLFATGLPSVSEPGRVFFKVNNNFYYKIFPRVTLNVSFYGNWDSRPPFGLPGSDYGTSTGLGWTFGNK